MASSLWRGLSVTVEFGPSEGYPGDVSIVVKSVQVFHQKSIILTLNINNSKTTLVFGFACCFPGY